MYSLTVNPAKQFDDSSGLNHYFYSMAAPVSSHSGIIETWQWETPSLGRQVQVDLYHPPGPMPTVCPVLLVNDGQDLHSMSFPDILQAYWLEEGAQGFLVAAIHAGKERRLEYGTIDEPDYLGRGSKAGHYCTFIMGELLPKLHRTYPETVGSTISIAGFSLGGLSAFDLAWQYPDVFHTAGVFSGSFWWRSLDQTDPLYSDSKHRIMHQRVKRASYNGKQRFFFQCGSLDEVSDRNRNGVIDSIDDTLDLIDALTQKGVARATHIYYLELADGKHDVQSWGRAFPFFLRWNYAT